MPSDDLAAAEAAANRAERVATDVRELEYTTEQQWLDDAAAIRAVVTRCREQAAEIADQSDFMAFMHTELAKFPCLCEDGKHADTAPMFWPELIRCIVARAVKDAQAEVQHGK